MVKRGSVQSVFLLGAFAAAHYGEKTDFGVENCAGPVVARVAREKGLLTIGLSLVLVHIVCIPITGTSVNPARSIGPALFQGGEALSQLWLFIVAPFVGAAVSALVWNYFGDKNEKK